MTPFVPGGSTINGTPGGDGWAQVLGGQIDRLSWPRQRVDADYREFLAASGRVYVRVRIWK